MNGLPRLSDSMREWWFMGGFRTSENPSTLVDLLGIAAEQSESGIAVGGFDLAGEPVGKRNVIGIEPRDEWRTDAGNPPVQGGDEAYRLLPNDRDPRIGSRDLGEDRWTRVAGPVVHNDELEIADGLLLQALDRIPQKAFAVANRHEHAYGWRRHFLVRRRFAQRGLDNVRGESPRRVVGEDVSLRCGCH